MKMNSFPASYFHKFIVVMVLDLVYGCFSMVTVYRAVKRSISMVTMLSGPSQLVP